MIGRGRFFQRAELDPKWPICFLIIVIGIILSIFEGSLGLWSALYGSTPMLSLIFLYWVALHHEKYVLLITGFLIGLTSDLLFSDLIGGRATIYIAVTFAMDWRRQKLLQSDFRDIWIDFSVVTAIVVSFQLLVFSALNFALPSLTPVLFQIGLTMSLFPIGYVIMATTSNTLQRLRTL